MDTKSSTPKPAAAPTPPIAAPASETNGLAVAALVTGLLGFGIIPIILGVLGLKKPGGRGMSIAGIVLGVLSVLAWIAVIVLIMVGAFAADSVVDNYNDNIRSYQDEQQAEYEAQTSGKKEYAKGETAKFGNLEVKVDKVTRNYVPTSQFSRAADGKELVVLDLTVKNVGKESEYVSSLTFQVEDSGLQVNRSFAEAPGKELDSGQLTTDGTLSGQVVFEVTAGSQSLKLVQEDSVYNPADYKTEKVKYSLAF